MRPINCLLMILFLSPILCGLSSCTDETNTGKGTLGDGHTLQILLTVPANQVVAPMTKATRENTETVNDLNILIYDDLGNLIEEESKYLTSSETIVKKLSEVGMGTEGNNTDISVPYLLTDIAPGNKTVYVVANIGSSLFGELKGTDDISQSPYDVTTKAKLEGLQFGLADKNPRFIMFAAGQSFNVDNNPSIESKLERIYSMITVKVNTSLNQGISVVPKSVTLKHIPNCGSLKPNNSIGKNNVVCFIDGETISRESNLAFLTVDHNSESVQPLFMYENMQGNGSNISDLGQSYKTPPTFNRPTSEFSAVKDDRTCSYIEVKADYQKDGQTDVPGSGQITYRFFLGDDNFNNFDVERNSHYQITLSITGNGGIDETSWRVDKDLLGDITVEDIYIGYKQGSEGFLPITGDVDKILSVISDDYVNFEVLETSLTETGKGTTRIKAKLTNTSPHTEKICNLTYRLRGSTVVRKAKVHQVIRIVDPIAHYWKANSSGNQRDIEVKEFKGKYGEGSYEIIDSKGRWTATIEKGDWFKLVYNGKETSSSDAKISSEINGGPVKFKCVITKNAGEGKNLYGSILVKYHREQCEHRIFLRQGYGDVQLLPGGPTWSSFNLTGNKKTTTYPTETGWFFKRGKTVGMHPFVPGYRVKIDESNPLVLSDGNNMTSWGDPPYAVSWNPCPDGYKVPTENNYKYFIDNTITATQPAGSLTLYAGFVHDDSPFAGWRYDGKKIVLESNNYCNPAKGTLFVNNSTGANIFFSYGKGVMTEHNRQPEDTGIDEIGIGYRDGAKNKNGILDYAFGRVSQQRYGAFYWTESGFPDQYKFFDFWYNITNESGIVVNQWGSNHGMFIRCVKK